MTELPDFVTCPVCNSEGTCAHLLLSCETESQEMAGGLLLTEITNIHRLFDELFMQVHERQAICGKGLIFEATRAFFRNYGLIEGTNHPYAQIGRDYVNEYVEEGLSIAPNITRGADSFYEYIWSEMPEAALDLMRKQARELKRLTDLPRDNKEWIPENLEDIYR